MRDQIEVRPPEHEALCLVADLAKQYIYAREQGMPDNVKQIRFDALADAVSTLNSLRK